MSRSVMERFDVSGLFEPDILLASQTARAATLQPEQRLMLAVLEDAVDVLQKHRRTVDPRARSLYRDTLGWLTSHDRSWPFSAANICDALGIDHGYICAGLTRPPTPPLAA